MTRHIEICVCVCLCAPWIGYFIGNLVITVVLFVVGIEISASFYFLVLKSVRFYVSFFYYNWKRSDRRSFRSFVWLYVLSIVHGLYSRFEPTYVCNIHSEVFILDRATSVLSRVIRYLGRRSTYPWSENFSLVVFNSRELPKRKKKKTPQILARLSRGNSYLRATKTGSLSINQILLALFSLNRYCCVCESLRICARTFILYGRSAT